MNFRFPFADAQALRILGTTAVQWDLRFAPTEVHALSLRWAI